MARNAKVWTAITLAGVMIVVLVALLLESSRNPTFRPGDYGSFTECVENIPEAWLPGSLEHTGAVESCGWIHSHGQGGQP